MKVLITGSNGLLGQKLIDLFSKTSGHEVMATSKGENRSLVTSKHIQFKSMDITNSSDVDSVINDFKPEVIINTAAMTNVDQCETEREDCWKLNVEAVGKLINASNTIGSHFIHLSTDFIFDGENGPYNEEDSPNPISYYGESKLAAEKLVQENSKSYTVLRTVLVYGYTPGMSRTNIVLWTRQSLLDEKPIRVVTDQWRTPTLAEDLAQGCYLAAIKKASGIFNISGKELMTPYDIALKTGKYFNLNLKNLSKTDGSAFNQPAKRPPKTGFDISKAEKELGYNPHPFKEGLKLIERQLGTDTI